MIETTLFSQNGTLTAGQTIRHYRLVRPIGQGGMAEVWLAMDIRPQMHNRAYAIKFAHLRTPEDTERRARFRRELQTLIQLQHGHIVGLIDTDEHENSPYLVMEYLPGGTLADIQRPVAWQTAVRALAPIAHALAAAHQGVTFDGKPVPAMHQGVTFDDQRVPVVHRDVKPSNILIRSQNPGLDLVITDFGIVRFTEAVEGATAQFHTAEAQRIGTLAYMSPEQLLGEEITPKSDVFSLAVVLYELITGQRPFESDSLKVVAAALAIRKPMPDPRKNDKSIPVGLVQLLKKALAYDVRQRISMAEFAAQLDRLKMGEAPAATPNWAGWLVGGLALVGVVGCIATLGVAAWIGLQRTQNPLEVAGGPSGAGQTTEVSQVEMSNPATATPTFTPMPSATPTLTPTSTITPTQTATATLPLDPYLASLVAANGFEGGNSNWEPVAWVFDDDPTGATMLLVPPGCFMMGSETGEIIDRPVHNQCFDGPFWIDKTEVTRGHWQMCVAAGVCRIRNTNQYSQRSSQPINNVNWYDAVMFCEWRGGRLPTEREWEYAAAGPDGWIYPWGNTLNRDLVVYSGNSGSQTADVGSRPGGASWVGALDMSGNVWEWVSSKFLPYPYTPGDGREDLTMSEDFRVRRGGAFGSNIGFLHVTNRFWGNPTEEDGIALGFRCARSP